MPNDSGWMSPIADIDGDGHPDLIVVNGENGVTSELCSYIYWGGPGGLTGKRTEFPAAGAYDVALADMNGDGRLDLLFPSAWVDHHNPGRPKLVQVFLQGEDRRFEDASERYGMTGFAALSIACEDLTGNGSPDLVLACRRDEIGHQVDSLIYWNGPHGLSPDRVRRLHGLGPHYLSTRDFGNAYTREPLERYVSPPFELRGRTPVRIHWQAEVPLTTELTFQLRWADSAETLQQAEWHGSDGAQTHYRESGREIQGLPAAR